MATREITDSRTVIGVNALASRSLVVDRDLSAGDYVAVDNNGVEATTTALLFHATATASARSIAGRITGINSFGPKYGAGIGDLSGQNRLFVASNSPVNAIRFENAGGGNLTAGSLFVKARR